MFRDKQRTQPGRRHAIVNCNYHWAMGSKVVFFSLLEVYVEIHMLDHVPENSDLVHLTMSLLCLKSPTYSLVLKIKPAHHSMADRSCMIKLPLRVLAQHPGFPLDSSVHSAPFTSAHATVFHWKPSPSPPTHPPGQPLLLCQISASKRYLQAPVLHLCCFFITHSSLE